MSAGLLLWHTGVRIAVQRGEIGVEGEQEIISLQQRIHQVVGVEEPVQLSAALQRQALFVVPGGQERGRGLALGALVVHAGELKDLLPGQTADQALKGRGVPRNLAMVSGVAE